MLRWSSDFRILVLACKSSIPVNLTQPAATRRALFWMTWSFVLDDPLVFENLIGAEHINSERMSDL